MQSRGAGQKDLAQNMIGKDFDLKIQDNGAEFKVYIDDQLVAQGPHARTSGENNFKWGAYQHGSGDAIVNVSNASQA